MTGIDGPSLKMRMVAIAQAGRIVADNLFWILVVAGLVAAVVAVRLPGTGRPKVHRATITALWPG